MLKDHKAVTRCICLVYINMFAKFDEIPAMTFQDIKETKSYGRMYAQMHGQHENSISSTKFAGGIITQNTKS